MTKTHYVRDLFIMICLLAVVLTSLFYVKHSAASEIQVNATVSSNPTQTRWEYKAISIHKFAHIDEYNRILNEFGSKGWELVTVERFILHGGNDSWRFFFKRPFDPDRIAETYHSESTEDALAIPTDFSQEDAFNALARAVLERMAGEVQSIESLKEAR